MAAFLGVAPKIYVAGEEGSPLSSVTGKPVRIEEIRAEFNKDNLFVDLDFDANATSIGPIRGDPARGIPTDEDNPTPESLLWLRPHEICEFERKTNPRFDGPFFAATIAGQSAKQCSEFDIKQGSCLGDCWLMVGLEALTTKPDILNFVIPEDNFTGFDDDKYCGAFHFRFYDMGEGEWVDVVVDDRLPWQPAPVNSPAFAKVKNPLCPIQAEFWVALIEKAYAKFVASYAAINGGQVQQGLENFSNGFGEYVPLKNPGTFNLGGDGSALADPNETIKKFMRAYIKSGFMGVGSYGGPQDKEYTEDIARGYGDAPGLGIRPGHAYSVLDVQDVDYKPESGYSGSRTLVQLKNPWGHVEWTGAFSDTDDFNWDLMAKDLRIVVGGGLKNMDEGVFWMDIADVILYFKGLMICHFGLTDGTRLATAKGFWAPELQNVHGEPAKPEDRTRFKAYRFEVKQGPEAEKYTDKSGGQAIVLFTVVLQKYTSVYQPGVVFIAELYKLDSPDQDLLEAYKKDPVRASTGVAREASGWAFVSPGHYVIVPMLIAGEFPIPGRGTIVIPPKDYAGKEIGYTLRVFTENETQIEELQYGA